MPRKIASVRLGALRGPIRLKAWRVANGISRRDLAALLGLKDESSVTKYENGLVSFPFPHLIRLHEMSEIPIWDLAWPDQRVIIRALSGADPTQQPRPEEPEQQQQQQEAAQ